MRILRMPLLAAPLAVGIFVGEVWAGEARILEHCKMEKSRSPLHDAVRRNALTDVMCLVEQGYPINTLGQYGQTAVSYSYIGLKKLDDRVLKYFLKSGADLTAGETSIISHILAVIFDNTEEIEGNLEDRSAGKVASELPFYFRALEQALSRGGNMNTKEPPLGTSNAYYFAYELCKLPLADKVDFKAYFARLLKATNGAAAFQAGETKLMKQARSLVKLEIYSGPCIAAALDAFGEDSRI